MSRITKSLLTLVATATLAGSAAPAFADDDPPAGSTPVCFAADGTPVFDAAVCADLGRQASGH